MWTIVLLTGFFTLLLFVLQGLGRRKEVMENWNKYRIDPRYLFTAFLYRPDDDPRSRLQFTSDNFQDVLMASLTNTFKVFLAPVFQIFKLFMDAVTQTLGGLFNIHGLLQTMWKHFTQMIDIFMRRYGATFHELRMTYQKLFTALSRTWSIAMAGVWQGFSTVYATMSFIDLLIKVCIAILIILIVIVIILWLFLWPIVPALLVVIGIVTMAGFGAAVGGMGASLCFGPDAQVVLEDGTHTSMAHIRVGDRLYGGIRVTASMKLKEQGDFYSLHGIPVSGSHIVYVNNQPTLVRDHPNATPIQIEEPTICCLNTDTHRIPIYSSETQSIHMFADWEEIDSDSLEAWNQHVFALLNPDIPYTPFSTAQLDSDPLVSPDCQVLTPSGPISIQSCAPGMFVLDADGLPTEVLGVVTAEQEAVVLAEEGLSVGCWRKSDIWTHPNGTMGPLPTYWMSLLTASGTYRVIATSGTTYTIRDFTDVGLSTLPSMATWTLSRL
jgi:hypothetical protein